MPSCLTLADVQPMIHLPDNIYVPIRRLQHQTMTQTPMNRRTTLSDPRFVLLAALIWLLAACQPTPTPEALTRAPEALTGLERFENLAGDHVSGPVSYPQTPPVGGPHNPFWQNCGIYAEPVPNEQAVHSLEHGAVWITYRPDLATDQVDLLRDLVRGNDHALLSPYPDLPAAVVASAWGAPIKLDGAEDPRLPVFFNRFLNNPEAPEPGASCADSVGAPIE
jgi:hypothetical protein